MPQNAAKPNVIKRAKTIQPSDNQSSRPGQASARSLPMENACNVLVRRIEKAQSRANIMKIFLASGIALLLFCLPSFGQDTYPGGIIYGPKAAFNVSAPPGWVLDNTVGAQQGLPCVLYPKGSSTGALELKGTYKIKADQISLISEKGKTLNGVIQGDSILVEGFPPLTKEQRKQ